MVNVFATIKVSVAQSARASANGRHSRALSQERVYLKIPANSRELEVRENHREGGSPIKK
jgi:hypothetical protein